MSYTFNLTDSQVDNIVQTVIKDYAFGLARDIKVLRSLKDLKSYEKEDLENDQMYLEYFKGIIGYFFIQSQARQMITDLDDIAFGEPNEEIVKKE